MEKKIGNIIGIKPPEISINFRKKKKTPGAENFWNKLVGVWFQVYADLIPPEEDGSPAKPSFDGPEQKHMKYLLRELRERAEKKNIEWTEEEAIIRFKKFLLRAFEDDFISKNFMLRIMSNNKTKIFNNQITPKKNGSNIGRVKKDGGEGRVAPGGFGQL